MLLGFGDIGVLWPKLKLSMTYCACAVQAKAMRTKTDRIPGPVIYISIRGRVYLQDEWDVVRLGINRLRYPDISETQVRSQFEWTAHSTTIKRYRC